MKNSKMISLDENSLKEVNGGSQYSYESGLWVGDVLRKWLIACGIVRIVL